MTGRFAALRLGPLTMGSESAPGVLGRVSLGMVAKDVFGLLPPLLALPLLLLFLLSLPPPPNPETLA